LRAQLSTWVDSLDCLVHKSLNYHKLQTGAVTYQPVCYAEWDSIVPSISKLASLVGLEPTSQA